MATGDYTTLARVRQQLGMADSDTADDAYLGTLVSAASRMIDGACKRRFYDATGTLYLDCRPPTLNGRKLYFDEDVVSVSSVTNGDGAEVTSDEYHLLPVNSTPKYAIELTIASNKIWQYTTDWRGAITVVAARGYCTDATRPGDIEEAATRLAVWLYQNRDNTGETVQFADGSMSIPAEAPPMVMRILEKGGYVRIAAYGGE
ncbi:MAG: phage gp6-like head-tail connector protein [Candidatus Portnoybacteria bacterium]|nr:phage gp6-like head-tail connector protein [Candidatus Portnoybacteria bacterium]